MKISLAMLDNSPVTDELNKDIREMDALVEQLLEAERLDQGNQVLHLSSYYLPSLIDEVVAEQRKSHSIVLLTDIPEKAIQVDVGRIKFLLRNLLKNAIEHSPEDTPVELAVQQTENTFVLKVIDKGAGIPKALADKIFEPFYRAENIDNRSTKGVGLGLYLCRKIALAHQGCLGVDSTPGEGCCFVLTLPKRA